MIPLTRLDGSELYLNADLIEQIEAHPDTVIVLTTHKKFVVRESVADVIQRVIAFRRSVQPPFSDASQRPCEPERHSG